MSATSLSKLISTRKEELARLLEWRGTDFPVVERQNDLRISFIELELEDLEKLNNQPQLNPNQQIVLDYLKEMCPPKLGVSAMVTAYYLVDDNINDNWQEYSEEIPPHIEALQELSVAEENQALQLFSAWVNEQEAE